MNQFAALITCLVIAAAATAADAPIKKGFVVHEWGVFRVNTDVDFANADLRAEWDDLPEFVYGQIKGRSIPQHWGAVESRRKPIIFFHATDPVQARVKIGFPGGQAGVWYPATEVPAVFGFDKRPKISNLLEWNLAIKTCPSDWRPKNPNPLSVQDKHWVNRIRHVKTEDVFARYSPNPADVEREKFLYYDGIFPQGKWLQIVVDKDNVSLTSQVKHPIFDLTLVDRRDDKVRVGRIARIEAGQTIARVPFEEVDGSRLPSEGAETLVKQLTTSGLFEDEARSLADLWNKEMFETPGLNLFYRLPPEEYEARLPLTITPKPETTVRTGLVYHAHLEPDFAQSIFDLVKQLDAAKFAERDAAIKKLHRIGPAALVQLLRIRERKDLSVEVRERIDSLVKKWHAKEGFDDTIETPKP